MPYGHRVAARGRLSARFEMRESPDPWRGRQPRFKKIVRRGPRRFELLTKLPSGEAIAVPLGRLAYRRSERR